MHLTKSVKDKIKSHAIFIVALMSATNMGCVSHAKYNRLSNRHEQLIEDFTALQSNYRIIKRLVNNLEMKLKSNTTKAKCSGGLTRHAYEKDIKACKE